MIFSAFDAKYGKSLEANTETNEILKALAKYELAQEKQSGIDDTTQHLSELVTALIATIEKERSERKQDPITASPHFHPFFERRQNPQPEPSNKLVTTPEVIGNFTLQQIWKGVILVITGVIFFVSGWNMVKTNAAAIEAEKVVREAQYIELKKELKAIVDGGEDWVKEVWKDEARELKDEFDKDHDRLASDIQLVMDKAKKNEQELYNLSKDKKD